MPFFVEWEALKGENPWTGCNIKYTMVVLFNTAVWALNLSFHSHAAGERLDLVNFLPRFASDRPC